MTESIKRFLKRIRSDKILNRIGSGRMVYFENPIEEIALRYIPGENGRVASTMPSITAVMNMKLISTQLQSSWE